MQEEFIPVKALHRYGYSLFALLIFLGGVYFGITYFPAEGRHSPETLSDAELPAEVLDRTVVPSSRPEDFFPAAEFRQQGAILLGCQNNLNVLPELYVDIARAIDRRVPLFGVVSTEAQAEEGSRLIRRNGLSTDFIKFVVLPSSSMWIRDYAPMIIRYDSERSIMVDAKYTTRTMREKRKKDDFMGFELARMLDLPLRSIPLVLEGGNLISNGDGMLLTSVKTVLENKKSHYEHDQIMHMFNDFLGVNSVYTVTPLFGEPNGHTDMFMTMLDKNLAIVGEIDPAVDPTNSEILNRNAKFISSITTSSGPIRVKRIPMPPRLGEHWRSYTNVIMANGVLLMPSFSGVDPAIESKAEQIYRSSLPDGWEVKRINCDKLVSLNGQLHCISYNIPSFVSIEGLLRRTKPIRTVIE